MIYIINKETGEKVDMVEKGIIMSTVKDEPVLLRINDQLGTLFTDVSDKYEIRIESDVRSKEEIEEKLEWFKRHIEIVKENVEEGFSPGEDYIMLNMQMKLLKWILKVGDHNE